MSEAEACSIARAFWDEFSPHLSANPPSSTLVQLAARLSRTGHENRFANSLSDFGLAADIPLTYVDCGLKETHPVLSIKDVLRCLNASGKMDILLQGNLSSQFSEFWKKWKLLQPEHPVYTVHAGHEGQCVPVSIHCDEGTTLKKKSLMIIQLQATMGRGTRKRKSTHEEPGCNMIGNSIVTRILWSVMLGRVYGGKRKNKPLLKLMSHLTTELGGAFYQGIDLDGHPLGKVYLVPISMKGDWPALVKIGSLNRHFGRLVTAEKGGYGICHLCKADQPGHENWHDLTFSTMQSMHDNAPLPWKTEPALVSAVPLKDSYKAEFFRIDIFHTLHKGFMGDIAANAVVSWIFIFQLLNLLFQKRPNFFD